MKRSSYLIKVMVGICRSSHGKFSLKIIIFLYRRLFFKKFTGLRSAILLKKRLGHRCFPVSFEVFKKNFFTENFQCASFVYVFPIMIYFHGLSDIFCNRQNYPLDTGRIWNVHKTFTKRLGRSLNIFCTFNLRPVSRK